MLPSVKTLQSVFGDKAKEARFILEMSRDQLEELPAGSARVRECYNRPPTWEVRMSCLDALGETYGIEGFQLQDGSWVYYLNSGDTYNPTLIYWRGRYQVRDWGSIVERHGTMGE